MKKIIFIGEGCWFIDSLLYFKEQNVQVYVLLTQKRLRCFEKNIDILKDFGYEIYQNIEDVYPLLDKDTIILGGGNFAGDVETINYGDDFKGRSQEELEVLYNLSKYNKNKGCGAKTIRYFNGDTGWASEAMIRFFDKNITYVDLLIFDNESLMEYVKENIPSANNKKCCIGWIETPLDRFVVHNINKIKKRIVSLGRSLCCLNAEEMKYKELPISFYPIDKKSVSFFCKKWRKFLGMKWSYSLAGQALPQKIYEDRKLFQKAEGVTAFGLSHMYDCFLVSPEEFTKNKKYYFSLEGQRKKLSKKSPKECYYAFVNSPNKEACYLMNGIIPLISNTQNSYYKQMLEKKMAILIKTPKDLEKILKMSRKEIQKYRDNIYNNRYMFTFETVGNMIMNEFGDCSPNS